MAKVLWGIDPLAVSKLGQESHNPPFTKEQLAQLGIPAHKICRVQDELARLSSDKKLSQAELLDLAQEISDLLL